MSISFDPSPEQAQIVDAVARVLAERFPLARLRGAQSTSPDRPRLGALVELGAFGLTLPETLGGTGCGIAEEVLVAVELGRHLVTPAALAATLAAQLAALAGAPDLARAIAAGSQGICMANALRPFSMNALGGLPVHLLDAQPGDLALLWHDDGMALLPCAGMQAQPVMPTDRAVPLQRGTVGGAPLLHSAGTSPLVQRAHLLLSAQLLGMAEATQAMAVAYARLRTQFGKPIGAFQAIKHRCADMAIRTELLRAQVLMATLAAQHRHADAAFQADACRLLAAPCALANARANIQIHGAIGFTAECDAHLVLLRSHLYATLGGSRAGAEQRLLAPAPARH